MIDNLAVLTDRGEEYGADPFAALGVVEMPPDDEDVLTAGGIDVVALLYRHQAAVVHAGYFATLDGEPIRSLFKYPGAVVDIETAANRLGTLIRAAVTRPPCYL